MGDKFNVARAEAALDHAELASYKMRAAQLMVSGKNSTAMTAQAKVAKTAYNKARLSTTKWLAVLKALKAEAMAASGEAKGKALVRAANAEMIKKRAARKAARTRMAKEKNAKAKAKAKTAELKGKTKEK